MADFFPIFMDLTNKLVIIVGGGVIGTRRALSLVPFGCEIIIIAPNISHELEELEGDGKVQIIRTAYRHQLLIDFPAAPAFILAATDNCDVNHIICEDAKTLGILVNRADCKEESTFYFPGIARSQSIVVGVTANGLDHKLAKEIATKLKQWLKGRE